MNDSEKNTMKKLAIELNNKAWSFFEKRDLSAHDIASMLECAYTSLHLWSLVGKDINIARGHWLISRAACVAKEMGLSRIHANLCDEWTAKSEEGKADFDLFYANEALSRSLSFSEVDKAKDYYSRAKAIALTIADEETKKLCLSDLATGPWGVNLESL